MEVSFSPHGRGASQPGWFGSSSVVPSVGNASVGRGFEADGTRLMLAKTSGEMGSAHRLLSQRKKTNDKLPKRMRSPSLINTGQRTGSPLIKVPFVLFKSIRKNPLSSTY